MPISFLKKNILIITAAWIILIFILCATPGRYIPEIQWLDALSVDKFVHAGVFFVLNALLIAIRFVYNQNKNLLLVYLLLSVFYGALLELMQAKVLSDRSADVLDIAANTFGCLLAFFLNKKITNKLQ